MNKLKNNINFHSNIKVILKVILVNIILFSFFRIIFFAVYFPLFKDASFLQVVLSFLNGIRFDLSTTFQVYSLLFLIMLLPFRWTVSTIANKIYRFTVMLFLSFQIIILASDIIYYGFVHRHLAREILNLKNDITPMFLIIVKNYYIHLAVSLLFIYLVWKIVNKAIVCNEKTTETLKFNNLRKGINYSFGLFLFLLIAVVSWRGGLQSKPLRVSYAFTSDNIALGHLTLNGVYTMFQAIYKSGLNLNIDYDYKDAVLNARKYLKDENQSFLNDEYPLLRMHKAKSPSSKQPNVVIFIMESWSGDSVGALGSDMGLTPSFDALSKKGRLFTNVFSVGQRSLDAVVSILYSFPSFTNATVVGKVYEQNNMTGIGNILKDKGYSSLFICGARKGSMGFDAFANKMGFDRYIAKEDFKLPKQEFDGSWGVYDEHAFLRADEEFKKMKKPFLGILYTLNPHTPYNIPDKRFEKVKTGKNAKYYNALFYSDWALGEFFKSAKNSEYFDNTLFVIVADHCEGKHEESVIDSFRIPCLFYYPERIKPELDTGTVSQLDILPGIIDVLKNDCVHSSLGKSPFNKSKGQAVISYGNIYGIIMDEYIFLTTSEKSMGLYNWKKDKALKDNIAFSNNVNEDKCKNDLFSFLKLTEVLMKENKMAPLLKQESKTH